MRVSARIDRVRSDLMGTFGRLSTSLGFSALTIEMPWMENARNVSSIPPGEYRCEWTFSPTFRRHMYLVCDVPGRTGIRIHPGNLAGSVADGFRSHFAGCIGLGARLGVLGNQRALLTSAPTVLAFELHMGRQPFDLVIT